MTLLKSNRDLITQQQVFTTSKLRLGLEDSSWDAFFMIELQNALRKLKTPSVTEVRQIEIELCNKQIALPIGFQELLGVCFPDQVTYEDDEDSEGFDTQQVIPRLYVSRGVMSACGFSCACIDDFMRLESGYLYVNLPDQSAVITYLGYRLSEDGTAIMLYDTYEDCLASYLCHMFLLANPTFFGDIYATMKMSDTYYQKYIAAKNGLRGAEQRQQFVNERPLIDQVFNRVHINNFESYFGLGGIV